MLLGAVNPPRISAKPHPAKKTAKGNAAPSATAKQNKTGRKVTFNTSPRHTTSPATSPIPDDVTYINPFVTSLSGAGANVPQNVRGKVRASFPNDKRVVEGVGKEGEIRREVTHARFTLRAADLEVSSRALKNSILKPLVPRRTRSAGPLEQEIRQDKLQSFQAGQQRKPRPKTTSSATIQASSSPSSKRRLGADLYPVLHRDDLDRERDLFRSGVGVLTSMFGRMARSQSARWRAMEGAGGRNGGGGGGGGGGSTDYFCRTSKAEACLNNAHLAKVFHVVPQRAVSAGGEGVVRTEHLRMLGGGGVLGSTSSTVPSPNIAVHRLNASSASLCHRQSYLNKAIENSSNNHSYSYTNGVQYSIDGSVNAGGDRSVSAASIKAIDNGEASLHTNGIIKAKLAPSRKSNGVNASSSAAAVPSDAAASAASPAAAPVVDIETSKEVEPSITTDASKEHQPALSPRTPTGTIEQEGTDDTRSGSEPSVGPQQRLDFYQAQQLALRGVDLKEHHSPIWLEETRLKQEESVAILTEHLKDMLTGFEKVDLDNIEEDLEGEGRLEERGEGRGEGRREGGGITSENDGRKIKREEVNTNMSVQTYQHELHKENEEDAVQHRTMSRQHEDREEHDKQILHDNTKLTPERYTNTTAQTTERKPNAAQIQGMETKISRPAQNAARNLGSSALEKVAVTGKGIGGLHGSDEGTWDVDYPKDTNADDEEEEPYFGDEGDMIDRLCMKTMSCEVLGPYTCSDCTKVRLHAKQRHEQTTLYPGLAVDPRTLIAPDKLRRLTATLPTSLLHTGQRVTLQCGCVVSMHRDFLFPVIVTDHDVHSRLMASRAKEAMTSAEVTSSSSSSVTSPEDVAVAEEERSKTGSRGRSRGSSRDESRPRSRPSRESSSIKKEGRRGKSGQKDEEDEREQNERISSGVSAGLKEDREEGTNVTSPTNMKVTVRYTTPPDQNGRGPSVFITNASPEPTSVS